MGTSVPLYARLISKEKFIYLAGEFDVAKSLFKISSAGTEFQELNNVVIVMRGNCDENTHFAMTKNDKNNLVFTSVEQSVSGAVRKPEYILPLSPRVALKVAKELPTEGMGLLIGNAIIIVTEVVL